MKPIICPLKVSAFRIINYCYLIVNPILNTAVIVDPAWEIETIEKALQQHHANLTGILLTHHHYDHVHLAETLVRRYQIPAFMSKSEIDYYQFNCSNLTPITHYSEFTLTGITIKPIATPGHTFGGTSFLIENNLFCGDTLFIEGCGMCFGRGSDPEVLFDSLQFLKKIIPPETRIYPGHSYGEEPGKFFFELLKKNIYLQFDKKNIFVEFRMRKNQKDLFNFK